MNQIWLNDPHRPGAPSNLDINADTGVAAELNLQRMAQSFADANANFSALFGAMYYHNSSLCAPVVPFSTTVPLSGTFEMPPQSIFGPLAFAPAPNPVNAATCIVRLTADGVHVPTFPGFTVEGSWTNTAGAINHLVFGYDDSIFDVCIGLLGQASATPLTRPSIASISATHGSSPTITIATGGVTSLNPNAVPPISAFALSTSQGATIARVAVAANAFTLTLSGAVAVGDTVTLSYAPPPLNSPIAGLGTPIQDTSGNHLEAFSSAPVTVT